MRRAFASHFLAAAVLCCAAAAANAQAGASLHLVFVMDGLRPDSITERDTPHLHRLRAQGVWFEASHAVFPTVTRVNSTSISTGAYPARHGILGNTMFVPAVDPTRAFRNDSADMLLKVDAATSGRMVTAPGLVEVLESAGRKAVVVSSGSAGSSMLLAPKAHHGVGTLINGNGFPGGTVAYPLALGGTIIERFGPQPRKGGRKDRYDDAVNWSMEVLREHVLPELKPAVVITWMSEPDHIQHSFGTGSAEALGAIANNDRQIGLVLRKLEALGLREKTNIIVLSDHGFAETVHNINVTQALTGAGLMSAEGAEIVIASSGQAVALHVAGRDPQRIRAVVEFLQSQPWCGLVFTAARKGAAPHEGTAAGTFALEYAHLAPHEHAADVVFTLAWSSAQNRHGVRGTSYTAVGGSTASGPVTSGASGHGGISPWVIRNTMLAAGPDFRRGVVSRTPASNVDIAPTLLHLIGVSADASRMDGRILSEALAAGPDAGRVKTETRTLRVSAGTYRAVLQTSEVAGRRYIDQGWREQ